MIRSMLHESSYVSGCSLVPELKAYFGWVAHADTFAEKHSGRHEAFGVEMAWAGECFVDSISGTRESWVAQRFGESGGECLVSFNGLFSGVVADKKRKQVLLFNDRFGVERLYYFETAQGFYFASEAKALLRIFPELRAFDPSGLHEYLALGCTLGNRTLFRGLQRLDGGSLCVFEGGKVKRQRYFSPADWESQTLLSEPAFDAEFQTVCKRAMPRYYESAAAIGISLTGGLDSRMIVAGRPAFGRSPVCYTFAGQTDLPLDARIAARVAGSSGMKHEVLRIERDFLSDYKSILDRTVWVTDGCCGATGAHEIYLNRKARALSPVRMTGNFGSEVLRGVSTLKKLELVDGFLSPEVRQEVSQTASQSLAEHWHPVSSAAFREVPGNLFGTLSAARSQVTFRTPYLDTDLVALAYRLPLNRRTSPLPALRFVEQTDSKLARIPTDRGEIGEARDIAWLMRRAFGEITFKLDYLHKEGMPRSLSALDPVLNLLSWTGALGLHKFLPYRRWFQRDLASFLQDSLNAQEVRDCPFWNREFVKAMTARHVGGKSNYVAEINMVLTLQAIQRLFFRA